MWYKWCDNTAVTHQCNATTLENCYRTAGGRDSLDGTATEHCRACAMCDDADGAAVDSYAKRYLSVPPLSLQVSIRTSTIPINTTRASTPDAR